MQAASHMHNTSTPPVLLSHNSADAGDELLSVVVARMTSFKLALPCFILTTYLLCSACHRDRPPWNQRACFHIASVPALVEHRRGCLPGWHTAVPLPCALLRSWPHTVVRPNRPSAGRAQCASCNNSNVFTHTNTAAGWAAVSAVKSRRHLDTH